jgi:primary-amine oxidase
MTATIESTDKAVSAAADHPLTPLSADEIRAVRRIVDENGLLGESGRFVYAALEEPHKDVVLAFSPGDPIERRARVRAPIWSCRSPGRRSSTATMSIR